MPIYLHLAQHSDELACDELACDGDRPTIDFDAGDTVAVSHGKPGSAVPSADSLDFSTFGALEPTPMIVYNAELEWDSVVVIYTSDGKTFIGRVIDEHDSGGKTIELL